jgi:hypothetical protein
MPVTPTLFRTLLANVSRPLPSGFIPVTMPYFSVRLAAGAPAAEACSAAVC